MILLYRVMEIGSKSGGEQNALPTKHTPPLSCFPDTERHLGELDYNGLKP
jgi:hypothetical protein